MKIGVLDLLLLFFFFLPFSGVSKIYLGVSQVSLIFDAIFVLLFILCVMRRKINIGRSLFLSLIHI